MQPPRFAAVLRIAEPNGTALTIASQHEQRRTNSRAQREQPDEQVTPDQPGQDIVHPARTKCNDSTFRSATSEVSQAPPAPATRQAGIRRSTANQHKKCGQQAVAASVARTHSTHAQVTQARSAERKHARRGLSRRLRRRQRHSHSPGAARFAGLINLFNTDNGHSPPAVIAITSLGGGLTVAVIAIALVGSCLAATGARSARVALITAALAGLTTATPLWIPAGVLIAAAAVLLGARQNDHCERTNRNSLRASGVHTHDLCQEEI
jgi:hypothetical protein